MKGTRMTDMNKYKNVSLTKETYKVLEALSKVLLPDAKLSISKNKRVNALTEDEVLKIREFIDQNYKVEGDLSLIHI